MDGEKEEVAVKKQPEPVVSKPDDLEPVRLERSATPPKPVVQPVVLSEAKGSNLSFFLDRGMGILGLGALIVGLAFGGIYAGIQLPLLGRFILLVAASAILIGLGFFLSSREHWTDLGLWIRSAGGAVFLFATLSASGIDGMRWVNSRELGYFLLALGLGVNLFLGLLNRKGYFYILHTLFCLVALTLAPKDTPSLIAASLVVFSGVGLSWFRKNSGSLLAALVGFSLYLLYWSWGRELTPAFFSPESLTFLLVYGGTLLTLIWRPSDFKDGGRTEAVFIVLSSVFFLLAGSLLYMDSKFLSPLFGSLAIVLGASFLIRKSVLPNLVRETLGILVYISGIFSILLLAAWDAEIPFIAVAVLMIVWNLVCEAVSGNLKLESTWKVVQFMSPWAALYLLPNFHQPQFYLLANPLWVIIIGSLIPSLTKNGKSTGWSIYKEAVYGVVLLFWILPFLTRSSDSSYWDFSPILLALLILVADFQNKRVLSFTTFFASLIGIPFALLSLFWFGPDSFPVFSTMWGMVFGGLWWMGRSAFGKHAWVSTVLGAVTFLFSSYYLILLNWSVLDGLPIIFLLGSIFLVLQTIGLLPISGVWAFEPAQKRVLRIASEVVLLGFLLISWTKVENGLLPSWFLLVCAFALLAIGEFLGKAKVGGERVTFSAILFIFLFFIQTSMKDVGTAIMVAMAAILSLFVLPQKERFNRYIWSGVALFWLSISLWLIVGFPYASTLLDHGLMVAFSLAFLSVHLFSEGPFPKKYFHGGFSIPLMTVATFALGFSGPDSWYSLVWLALGLGFYTLALLKNDTTLRVLAFISVAGTSIRLIIVDFSGSDLLIQTLVFLISGVVITGMSLLARGMDRAEKKDLSPLE